MDQLHVLFKGNFKTVIISCGAICAGVCFLKSFSWFFKRSKQKKIDYFLTTAEQLVNSNDENNYEKAVELYNQAKELGSLEAYYNIGLSLLHGKGVEKNLNQACKYIKFAANQNHEKAMYKLYKLYLSNNNGFEQNDIVSAEWLEKAVKAKYPPALVQQAKEILRTSTENDAEAVVMLLEAVRKNNVKVRLWILFF